MAKSHVSRRKHTNSKLGCSNCKRKKIRCDEKLPQCGNCCRGKREVCSYLSLPASELNRIRLTHSLRNTQNKLLNYDYRLPTSSSDPQSVLSPGSIEFKYELMKLPLKIESKSYESIHFDNLSVNDFINYESSEQLSAASTSHTSSNKALSNALHKPLVVSKLKHKFPEIDPQEFLKPTRPNLSHQLFPGKFYLFDHFRDYLALELNGFPNIDIVFDSLFLVGLSTMENAFKKKKQYSKAKQSYYTRVDSKLLSNDILSRLKSAIEQYVADCSKNRTLFIHYNSQAIAYSCLLYHFDVDIDIEQYYQMSCMLKEIFNEYFKTIVERKSQLPIVITYLVKHLHYHVASVKIPSYDPHFLEEVVFNLKDLYFIYNCHPSSLFDDENLQLEYKKILYKFNCLLEFIQNDLLPIVFTERNEDYISVYPQTTIYTIVKTWHKIFPSAAMTYNPTDDSNKSYELRFLQDLTTTLYMYYFAISAALESIFPICKYLFTVSFMAPTTGFFKFRNIMTPMKYNLVYNKFNRTGIYEKLQNHIYYALRLYTFFQRRYLIYQNHIGWTKAYPESVKQHRWKSRTVKDAVEVPVKHFNTTLIRPEHYPTSSGMTSNSESFFNRTDENMENRLYRRNIEKLDFFNESSMQFDFETLLLLRDYRRSQDDATPPETDLTIDDLLNYYEDRTLILSTIFDKAKSQHGFP